MLSICTYVDIPVRRITSESPHAILNQYMCFEPFLVVYLGTYVYVWIGKSLEQMT